MHPIAWARQSVWCLSCCAIRICLHFAASVSGAVLVPHYDVEHLRPPSVISTSSSSSTSSESSDDDETSQQVTNKRIRPKASRLDRPHVAFPECGIFFWWQIAAVRQLSSVGRDPLSRPGACAIGASGGAITAILAACSVDADDALAAALRLVVLHGEHKRPVPLLFTWGRLIRAWLDEVLPDNASERCSGRVQIIVNTLPALHPSRITDFSSRADLIDCALAAIHIPFFVDGKACAHFRGFSCVDFAIFTHWRELYACGDVSLMDHQLDGELCAKYATGRLSFLRMLDDCGLADTLRLGKAYATRTADSTP
mmetsp:Transcript_6559/g.19449  ORF Transcript_6559/g.19449 Transcript_6559/m.19449 type:complete len:312 (-) Transcript_6559:238-1173(-)